MYTNRTRSFAIISWLFWTRFSNSEFFVFIFTYFFSLWVIMKECSCQFTLFCFFSPYYEWCKHIIIYVNCILFIGTLPFGLMRYPLYCVVLVCVICNKLQRDCSGIDKIHYYRLVLIPRTKPIWWKFQFDYPQTCILSKQNCWFFFFLLQRNEKFCIVFKTTFVLVSWKWLLCAGKIEIKSC